MSAGRDLLVRLDRGGSPLRAQLEGQLREAVRAGRLGAGVALPSTRALARELGVSRGVVVEAYAQLAAEGYLVARQGAPTRVSDTASKRSTPVGAPSDDPPPRHDFRTGGPDVSLFPRAAWLASLRRALRRAPDARLDYGDPRGAPELRAALAHYLGRVRGVACDPEQVTVTSGMAQGMAIFARVLAAEGGRHIAMEDPSSAPGRDQLAANGLAMVPVPVDEHGLRVDRLEWRERQAGAPRSDRPRPEDALERVEAAPHPSGLSPAAAPDRVRPAAPHPAPRSLAERAGLGPAQAEPHGDGGDRAPPAAVMVTPAHQFPLGVVLAPERRAALVEWAARNDALVLEDDYDAEYRYDRQPVGALQGLAPEQVAYAGSVSKTLAPALRLGWLVAPDRMVGPLAAAKARDDLGTPVVEQLALADFLERGDLDRHLRRTRSVYRRRRDVLVAALAAHLPECRPAGVAAGLHLVVHLPEAADEQAVLAAVRSRGIGLSGLSEHRIEPGPPALLLGYGRIAEAAIERGVRALADSLRA